MKRNRFLRLSWEKEEVIVLEKEVEAMVCTKPYTEEDFARELLDNVLQYGCRLQGDTLAAIREKLWQEWKEKIVRMVKETVDLVKGFRFKHRIKIDDRQHSLIKLISRFINLCTDSEQELSFITFYDRYINEITGLLKVLFTMMDILIKQISRLDIPRNASQKGGLENE
ncbi:MAG: hypothetical protein QXT77_08650 [Candidatus Methanomethylicaceae archaeon]